MKNTLIKITETFIVCWLFVSFEKFVVRCNVRLCRSFIRTRTVHHAHLLAFHNHFIGCCCVDVDTE